MTRGPIERAMADLASRQHGVVTRAQLVAIGFEPRAIDRRVEAGRLHRVHRGVYLVGHRVAPTHAREMAATLACGGGAVVSHRSAARLWALVSYPALDREIEVTVADRNPGAKPGIRVHRVRRLDRRDVRSCDGIPITTPARTLLDLAGQIPPRGLEQALAEAQRRRLVRRRDLRELIGRNPSRRGAPALRALVEAVAAPALTRSQAEERLLALVRAAALPSPDVNARIGGHEVDFLWRAQCLIVEVDGFAFHSSRTAFERDRLRDAELGAQGYRVMRVTWRQIVDAPEAMLVRITTALAIS
jgi:very-short-patch-repair endonuclease